MFETADAANKSEWTPPRLFDGYRLLWPISHARRGTVYLGHDTVLDRPVIVHFFKLPEGPNRELLLSEARMAARLTHPNLVAIHRVGEVQTRLYLISEYGAGRTLEHLERPLPWHKALDLALHLSSGLQLAHRRGLLHKDISPRSIVMSESGEVKLLHLGLSETLSAPDTIPPAAREAALQAAALTESTMNLAHRFGLNMPRGDEKGSKQAAKTPVPKYDPAVYQAPELRLGEPASAAADVYSLGALIYELISGLPPQLPTSSLKVTPHALPADEVAPLASLVPDCDPRLCAIIDKCLRQKFRSRYQNAEELHDALSQLRPQGANERIPEGNPYRGLLPFEAEHRALFFGRRSEIGTLIERLRTEAAVLIGAESGIGKSSLCRAGVLPLVAEGALGGGRTYQVVQLVPGPHPLQSLSAALARVLGVTEAALTFQMGRDPGGFGRALLQHLGDSRGILLFVDQLEELATLSDPTEANIVGEVLGSLLTRYPGIRLLMTVRSDFLGRVAMVSGIGEAVTRVLYILRPLSGDRIREAIVGPAHAKGVLFESPALVQSLVESTAHTDGGLPLLQFTLAELWEEREGNAITAAALSAIGGVSGALARHADHVLASLPPDKRAAAKRILIALVTMEGTRARRSEEELVRENPHAKVALETLVRGRLLVARDTPEGPAYDVAHEALIRGWDSLRHWLEEFKESRAARQRLESAAAEWRRQSKHRDALWNARQLRDLSLLSSEEIGPREQEFASASQAAVRKQRLRRSTSFLVVPILVGLSFGGAQLAERRTRQRAIIEHISEGQLLLAKARQQTRQVEEARQQSFTSFDNGKQPEGERLWERAQELAAEADRIYSRAGQTFEGVLTNDANNYEARTLLADSLYERALAAERDHHPQQTDDLLQRLALYDLGGTRKRQWEAPAKLAIDSSPGPATVEVARYERDAQKRWSADKVQTLGQTPLRNIELSPGSYLLTLTHTGNPPVRYPIRLTRGSAQQISVPLPRLEQIPKGFAYIPPGSFLFGSADDLLRKAFLATTPIHPVQTAGYLMAIHETTYGDWLEYLRAQPPEKRATLLLKGGGISGSLGGSGTVELTELPGSIWQLTLKPVADSYVVKEGEFLSYSGRKQRSRQDWLKLPIGGVTLDEAMNYAQWLASTGRVPKARLCSELEWERAARGADEREWPHSDELHSDDANYDETYKKEASAMGPDEVGSYPASRSPFGIDDMVGNVFEWMRPQSATDEGLVRSGGYFHSSIVQRSTNRNVIGRSLRDPNVGIRICADLGPTSP